MAGRKEKRGEERRASQWRPCREGSPGRGSIAGLHLVLGLHLPSRAGAKAAGAPIGALTLEPCPASSHSHLAPTQGPGSVLIQEAPLSTDSFPLAFQCYDLTASKEEMPLLTHPSHLISSLPWSEPTSTSCRPPCHLGPAQLQGVPSQPTETALAGTPQTLTLLPGRRVPLGLLLKGLSWSGLTLLI